MIIQAPSTLKNLCKLMGTNTIILILFLLVLLTFTSPNNIYLVLVFSICALFLPYVRKLDSQSLLLIAFSISYSFSLILKGKGISGANLISYIICPFVFFNFGRYIAKYDFKYLTIFLLLSIFCISVESYILTINDISDVGIVNTARLMYFSDGETSLSATLYGLVASAGIGLFPYCILVKMQRNTQIVVYILFFFSLLITIHLVNRSAIVVLVITTFIMLALCGKKKALKIAIILFILIFALYSILDNHIINDISQAYSVRLEDETNSSTFGGRTQRWVDAFNLMFEYPFGWAFDYGPRDEYAHNMWLDTLRTAGIIPFLLLSYISISIIKKSYKGIRLNRHMPINILAACLITSISLACFVEPVIEGKPLFFFYYLTIAGVISQLDKFQKQYIQYN